MIEMNRFNKIRQQQEDLAKGRIGRIGIGLEPGVAGIIMSAGSNPREGFDFSLDGDLCQMSAQKQFLRDKGFAVDQSDVYPVLRKSDAKRAMKLIWKHRVDGWWSYKRHYVDMGICTEEEFKQALKK